MSDLDPRTDFFDVVDGLEAVTLLRTGSSNPCMIPHALRRAITVAEAAASDGRYTNTDVRWHLPAAECLASPRLGDLIADGSGSS